MKLFIAMVLICTANILTIAWAVYKQPEMQVMCPMKVPPGNRGYWRV